MFLNSSATGGLFGDTKPATPGADRLSIKEADILAILNEAGDLSHGSEELLEKTRGLPHAGLLSPERANYLHPFVSLLRGNVLLVGDSGALARYVAELGCSVWVKQPNENLARLVRARCRGLDVKVTSNAPLPAMKFAAIVVTGLHEAFNFQPLREVLAPGGVIVAAADNRLTRPAAHEYQSEPVTRAALERALRNAGFEHIQFSYLFPSYERAQLIVPYELTAGHPALESIIAAYSPTRVVGAPAEEWWRDVLVNGILGFTANSFVAVASGARVTASPEGELLRIYSSDRRKHFARLATLVSTNEELVFSRAPLFPSAEPPPNSCVVRRSYAEPYLAGQLYSKLLEPIVQSAEWTPEDIAVWAKPWIDLLLAEATDREFSDYLGGFRRLSLLPVEYLDCIPSNIMLDPKGKLLPFDFEYEAVAPIPLCLVVFRGLFYTLSGVTACTGSPTPRLVDLVTDVMRRAGLKISDSDVDSFIQTEAALQNDVTAASPESTQTQMRAAVLRTTTDLNIAGNGPAINVELFWKDRDSEYQLERSSNAAFLAEQKGQTISFYIPASEKAVESLRLDPCDRRGLFYLYSVRIFQTSGDSIWSWDGNPSSLGINAKDLNFAELPTGGKGALLTSDSEDANFELDVPAHLLARLQNGGRVDIEMAAPDSAEYRILTRRLLDTRVLREQLAAALTEKESSFKAGVGAAEEQNRQLSVENERLRAHNNELEAQMQAAAKLAELEAQMQAAKLVELKTQMQAAKLAEIEAQTQAAKLAEIEIGRAQQANAELERNLHEVRAQLQRVSADTLRTERARDAVAVLNRELQEQLKTVNDQLKSVSNERDLLHRRIEEMQAQVENLSTRVSHVEQLVMGIFQGRIWRTLVSLGSPVKTILRRK